MDIWNELYNKAKEAQKPRTISRFVEAGGVSAVILTKQGNVYAGVCIDTACSLGMCAERNAIANMITNGESEIDKVVVVMANGLVGAPCGACRELMMQLGKDARDVEILTDLQSKSTKKLGEFEPAWWGDKYFSQKGEDK